MPLDKSQHAKIAKYISYRVQHFDVTGYVRNPNMIKTLYKEKEEAREEVRILRDQLEASRISYHELELQKQGLEHSLKDANWRAFFQLLITTVATVILGFGVNIATPPPHEWIGIVMVVLGGILEIVAFLITFLPLRFFNKTGKGK